MRQTRFLQSLLIVLALVLASVAPLFAASKADDEAYEIKMGNESATEIEKEAKLLKDPVLQERVDAIAKEIVPLANSLELPATYGHARVTKFDYSFKIIDDKEVNAFALPGGHVYINKGLLDFVQSDHELAGVIAHEITHASHHHMLQLLREQSKMNNRIALVLLAALVGKMPSQDLGNIVMGAQLVQIAKMSTYGQQAEADADRVAVQYLAKTTYNPVGLLTFLERLSSKNDLIEDRAGIMLTHPRTGERRATIIGELNALNIPITRRKVATTLKAMPKAAKGADGRDLVEIKIGDKVMMLVAGEDSQDAMQRAQRISDRVNDLLDSNVQMREVKTRDGDPTVTAKGEQVLKVTQDDASLSQSTPPQIARDAAEVIRSVIWKQTIDLAMIPSTKETK